MISRIGRIGLLVVAVLAMVGPVSATVHNITIGNNFFSPLGTVASVGDTVRWTWVGGIPHSTTSDAGSPKTWSSATSSAAGFTFEIVIEAVDGAGPFPYHCAVHALTMKDTIFVAGTFTCFEDLDGDGYGSTVQVSSGDSTCTSAGVAPNDLDCDDTDPDRNPGNTEIACDGIDNDCNAATPDEVDQDGDGVFSCVDCDDADPEIGACAGCCGQYASGFTGNTDCDTAGKRNLGDITKLIDRVYVTKADLCCEENGNTDGDTGLKINLGDITRLIDHVYVSKNETAACN